MAIASPREMTINLKEAVRAMNKEIVFGTIIVVGAILLAAFLPKELLGNLTFKIQLLIIISGAPTGICLLTCGIARKTGASKGAIIFSRLVLFIASFMVFTMIVDFKSYIWWQFLALLIILALAIREGVKNLYPKK